MKVYVTDDFLDFMQTVNIVDSKIAEVAKELSLGLHDGELLPKRMFFIAGWRKADVPKKGKEIPNKLLEAYKLFAEDLLNIPDQKLTKMVEIGLLKEVAYE
ncbi:hypothetical protein [Marinomonas algarum]|uniref:Uncharacterized protein n=1 Tax=Marinomonas algarum TaxID=2883105 RepID=A0A9X1IN90_9GAMM|nr:hypothetical protein [Marinomonas algarum]MCB5162564.1 hypothetical protein [Marinomonas algarum]